MGDIPNTKLLEILTTHIDGKVAELKHNIESINCSLHASQKKIEENCRKIEQQLIYQDRKIRKNNIVIFGLQLPKETILRDTLIKLNLTLDLSLNEHDVNNIYYKGNKCLVVEFISFLKKLDVIKNTRKLKGSNIFISHDLSPDDRALNKVLYTHLKKARTNGHSAYIKNFKLYINDKAYTPEELSSLNPDNTSKSAPTSPSSSQENLYCDCPSEERNATSQAEFNKSAYNNQSVDHSDQATKAISDKKNTYKTTGTDQRILRKRTDSYKK